MVEYVIVACTFVMALAVSVSVLGTKTVDLSSMTTSTLPGAHPTDNEPYTGGSLIPVTSAGSEIGIDLQQARDDNGSSRLGKAFGDEDMELLIDSARVD